MSTPYSRAPHAGGRTNAVSDNSPNAALLIDFDNVTMGMRSDLSKELKTLLDSDMIKGKVAVQRAYADWRRYPQYIVPLSEASIDLIFAPAYGSSKKNATDIRMAIDAVELVFIRPEIGTFILITGDSDFSSAVLKLKEYGKYVIGVGLQESSSDILVQNCDEYYSYNTLTGLRKASDTDKAEHDPWILVEKALDRMVQRGDVMRSDRLKQVMVEMDPSFDEGSLGFGKFSKFMAEASGKGLIELKKMENGQYEVGPAKGPRGGRRGTTRTAEARGSRRGERGRRGRGPRTEEGTAPAEGAVTEGALEGASAEGASAEGASDGGAPAEGAPAAAVTGAGEEAGSGVTSAADGREGAYRILADALRRLAADGREPARDSDVKRRILQVAPGFDEAELGFAKFSKFLLQAEADKVVSIARGENGEFQVTLLDGDRPAPDPQATAPRAQAKPRGRGRGARTSGAGTGAEILEGQAVQPRARRGRGGRGEGGRTEGGRTEGGRTEGGRTDKRDAGRKKPAARPSFDAVALGLPTENDAIVLYLTNSYKGVGTKTAEAVVDRFGGDTFRTMQQSPESIAEAIPARRATQLVEAWTDDYARRVAQIKPADNPAHVGSLPPINGEVVEELDTGEPLDDQISVGAVDRKPEPQGGGLLWRLRGRRTRPRDGGGDRDER